MPTRLRFLDKPDPRAKEVVMAELIAHDGRPFRDTSRNPSPPTSDTTSPLRTALVAFGAAERNDVLLRPPGAGEYWVALEWYQWVTGKVLGRQYVRLVAA